MRPAVAWFLALITLVAALAAWWLMRTPDEVLEQKLIPTRIREAAAMVPWRDPQGDLARFFPGQRQWSQQVVPLSAVRQKILQRLGSESALDSNVLYVYRVGKAGSLLVQRFSSEYGAVEVVIALNPARRIVGIRVQRHREPPARARLLEKLDGFRGKSADDPLPGSIPELAQAVHVALVALDTAEKK